MNPASTTALAAIPAHRPLTGIAVDLKHDAGKALLRRLVRDADCLRDNFRPGVMQRRGRDYAAMQRALPIRQSDFSIFVTWPISCTLIILSVLLLVAGPAFPRGRAARRFGTSA